MAKKKTSISLDEYLFGELEDRREEEGKDRSEFIEDVLTEALF